MKITKLEGYVFTFRFGDKKYGGRCQEVHAKDYGAARDIMCSRYGNDWAFQYPLEQWDKDDADPNYPIKLETKLPIKLVQVSDKDELGVIDYDVLVISDRFG